MDSMSVGVVLISFMGLIGVIKKSRRIMNLYFACVVVSIFIQGLFTIRGFLIGKGRVHNVSNLDLINKLQKE
ncbi:hypothetical protein BGX21_011073, partial [Mortierella sp. AD011]